MRSLLRSTLGVLLSIATLTAVIIPAGRIRAEEGDQFEGAVWQFELVQKKPSKMKVIGRFRIANNVVFQKDKPADEKFSKEVGKNSPDGKKTKFEVKDFRVFNEPDKKQQRFEGTARLKMLKLGEWSGMFTDKSGENWDMTCSRIQE